jgi:hypothetical protein
MKMVLQGGQIILVESRVANAAWMLLFLLGGLLAAGFAGRAQQPQLDRIFAGVMAAVSLWVSFRSAMKTLGGERWVFDRRTVSGRFLHNRRLLGPIGAIDHLLFAISEDNDSTSW